MFAFLPAGARARSGKLKMGLATAARVSRGGDAPELAGRASLVHRKPSKQGFKRFV